MRSPYQHLLVVYFPSISLFSPQRFGAFSREHFECVFETLVRTWMHLIPSQTLTFSWLRSLFAWEMFLYQASLQPTVRLWIRRDRGVRWRPRGRPVAQLSAGRRRRAGSSPKTCGAPAGGGDGVAGFLRRGSCCSHRNPLPLERC